MICEKLQDCINAELSHSSMAGCNNKKDNCIESSDNRSLVKCEENRKKYILENTKKSHVISYKMDGGIVSEDQTVPLNTNKCDYMYVLNSEETAVILTELKGVDVPKSLTQISGTLALYKKVFQNFSHVYARVIVTSSTPNLKATPAYTNLARMLRQTYKGNIKIVERQFTEKDTDLNK